MLSCERSRVSVTDYGECNAEPSEDYDIASHQAVKITEARYIGPNAFENLFVFAVRVRSVF